MISQHFSDAKQHREPQKRPHFDAFRHVTRWGAFFAIARPEGMFFRAHFAVILGELILHDFVHPSGSLLQVYEWSSERVKMRNFHHFLKRF